MIAWWWNILKPVDFRPFFPWENPLKSDPKPSPVAPIALRRWRDAGCRTASSAWWGRNAWDFDRWSWAPLLLFGISMEISSIEIVGYGGSMVFHQQTIFGPAFNTVRHKMVQDHADCRSGGVEITWQQITAKQIPTNHEYKTFTRTKLRQNRAGDDTTDIVMDGHNWKICDTVLLVHSEENLSA